MTNRHALIHANVPLRLMMASALAAMLTGLTTTASIWSTAAIGIAVGLGHYLLAGAILLQLVILHGLERFERPAR